MTGFDTASHRQTLAPTNLVLNETKLMVLVETSGFVDRMSPSLSKSGVEYNPCVIEDGGSQRE